jgi:DNA-binding transcriptional ArsR family regulator
MMPPKTVASILNNESNLKILEKLKRRPYYPKELAAEMKLSEPFIVRRLKALEEFDIIEGRWETEGSYRVKRYYVKDVTMQLGKDGLEVKSAEAQASTRFNLQKEVLGLLIAAPLVVLGLVGIVLNQPAITEAACLLLAWELVIDAAIYYHYRYKALVTEILLIIIGLGFFISNIMTMINPNSSSVLSGYYGLAYGAIFVIVLILHVRFSMLESRDWARDKPKFISGLDNASILVKLFYLLFVLRWKISEYLGLL